MLSCRNQLAHFLHKYETATLSRNASWSPQAHNAHIEGDVNMWKFVKSVFKKEEGQSLVEYALIIALVAVLLIASLQALQGGITGAFTAIVAAL